MAIDLLTPFTKVELKEKTTEHHRAIGLFWGSFDPVHIAHLTIADQVRQQLHLESVRFLPEKPSRHVSRMLSLATEGKTGLVVDSCRHEAHCGIYETVQKLCEAQPDVDFYFIIGGDMVGTLSHWAHITELAQLVQFVAVQRPRYRAGTSFPLLWVDVPLMDISGTQIRAMLAKGVTPNFLIAPRVLAYIKKEGLYV